MAEVVRPPKCEAFRVGEHTFVVRPHEWTEAASEGVTRRIGVHVTVDHTGTWRRKSGSSGSAPGHRILVSSLVEDLLSDLADVASGDLPEWAGRWAPESEQVIPEDPPRRPGANREDADKT